MIIPVGKIVHYVVKTQYGNYNLPAQIYGQMQPDVYHLRVFTDATGSEWLVTGRYSEGKEYGTFHFCEKEEQCTQL